MTATANRRVVLTVMTAVGAVASVLAGFLLGSNHWAILFLVLACLGAAAAVVYPWQTFLVVAFLVPFQISAELFTSLLGGSSLAMLASCVVLIAVTLRSLGRVSEPRIQIFDGLVLVFITVRGVAALSGGLSDAAEIWAYPMFSFLATVAVYFVATRLVTSKQRLVTLLRVVLASWLIWAVIGIAQYVVGAEGAVRMFLFADFYRIIWGGISSVNVQGISGYSGLRRVIGNWGYINFYAASVQFAFFAALAFTLARWRGLRRPGRFAAALAVGALGFNVVGTMSRSGFVGLLVGVCVSLWLAERYRKRVTRFVVIAGLSTAALAAIIAWLQATVTSPALASRLSIVGQDRPLRWLLWLEEVKHNLWIGTGYEHEYVGGLLNAHNTYLEIVHLCGVFGLAAFVALVLGLVVHLSQAGLHSSDELVRWLCFCSVGSVACFLFQGFFDYFIWAPSPGMTFWLFVGIWCALLSIARTEGSGGKLEINT